jgi:hypothetical protein
MLSGGMNVQVLNQTSSSAIVSGFDSNTLPANDDESTGAVSIGFDVNFFGTHYSSLFVNNNGNVTFDSPLSDFTPFNLSTTGHVIIAPFFADVDTRLGNVVTYGTGTVGGHKAFGVNWPGVGYYGAHIDKLDSFQLLLIDRSDIASGDFDIEFNYGQIQWETGDASGGVGGLGGFSARVGFSNGTQQPGSSFELPGSAVNGAFLDSNHQTGLVHSSFNSSALGRFDFGVRAGVPQTQPPEVPPPPPVTPPSPQPQPQPTTTIDQNLAVAVGQEDIQQQDQQQKQQNQRRRSAQDLPIPLDSFDKPNLGGLFFAPPTTATRKPLPGDFALILSSSQALPLGSISGKVFEDYNGDGLQSSNEPGLDGQVVYIDANGDGVLDENEVWTRTNEKGEYRFQGLTPGLYRIRQVISTNVVPTKPTSGERMVMLSPQKSVVGDQDFGAIQRVARSDVIASYPPEVETIPGPKRVEQTASSPNVPSPGDKIAPPNVPSAPVAPAQPAGVPAGTPSGNHDGEKQSRKTPEKSSSRHEVWGWIMAATSGLVALWSLCVSSPRQRRALSVRASDERDGDAQ